MVRVAAVSQCSESPARSGDKGTGLRPRSDGGLVDVVEKVRHVGPVAGPHPPGWIGVSPCERVHPSGLPTPFELCLAEPNVRYPHDGVGRDRYLRKVTSGCPEVESHDSHRSSLRSAHQRRTPIRSRRPCSVIEHQNSGSLIRNAIISSVVQPDTNGILAAAPRRIASSGWRGRLEPRTGPNLRPLPAPTTPSPCSANSA